MPDDKELLEETANAILGLEDDPWPALDEAGLTGVGVPEHAGGSGGDLADVAVRPGTNVAGESRDDVTVRGDLASVECPVSAGDVMLRGALFRAVQLTGAMRRVLELAVRYAGEREQFGRPVGRFQAVQQQLAELAGEVAVADVAVRAALRTPDDEVAVAAAKLNASRAAGVVADVAHQVHGAIGVTSEHPLGALTTRLWAWRDEFGGETHWARRLGELGRVPWETVTRTDASPDTVTW